MTSDTCNKLIRHQLVKKT